MAARFIDCTPGRMLAPKQQAIKKENIDSLTSRSFIRDPVASGKSICMDLQGVVDRACTAGDPMILLRSS